MYNQSGYPLFQRHMRDESVVSARECASLRPKNCVLKTRIQYLSCGASGFHWLPHQERDSVLNSEADRGRFDAQN